MKRRFTCYISDVGKVFVCTKYGYEKTLQHIKAERSVGKPIIGFEHSVPVSWIEQGYVKEIKE